MSARAYRLDGGIKLWYGLVGSFPAGGEVRRDKSEYALAREPYKLMHPYARMHHLRPTSRRGPDTEYNLFPWNERSHAAWHELFSIMTLREVWPVLADAHLLIFQSIGEEIVREWCTPYRYHGRKSDQKDMAKPRKVTRLQEAWRICFSDQDVRTAQRLVRYMMLYMVLGRYADHTPVAYNNRVLTQALRSVADDEERAWAFRQCFGRLPGRGSLRSLKKVIRSVRARAHAIPIL